MTRGTEARVSRKGPRLFHRVPPRVLDFQCTICAMLVSTASVTPKETECASRLEASDAAIPAKDARSKGQHQEPTSAGMDNATVNSDVHTPTLSSAASAARCCGAVLTIGDAPASTSHAEHSSKTPSSSRGARRSAWSKPRSPDGSAPMLAREGDDGTSGTSRTARLARATLAGALPGSPLTFTVGRREKIEIARYPTVPRHSPRTAIRRDVMALLFPAIRAARPTRASGPRFGASGPHPARPALTRAAVGPVRPVGEDDHRHGVDGGATRRVALVAALAAPILGSIPRPAPALASELEANVTDKVFFDLAIDSVPAGRVVVGVFGDASPIAAARFKALALGIQGLGYRRSEINAVEYEEENGADTPLFIADPGVKAFVIPGSSTPVEGLPGGPSTDALLPELAKSAISHRRAGLVSLTVERGAPPPPPKERLVSMNGKFVTVKDPPPPGPNGTGFVVTVSGGNSDTPGETAAILDRTNVVVGTVLEGMDVVEAIAALPTVKDNSSSPFFAVAKSIGDKRATVAEQAFGKPFAKVTVARCGIVRDEPPAPSETE